MPTEVITWLNSLRPAKEICVCAAWKTIDGRPVYGHRHSDCRDAIQGFITSTGRFVGRREALRLQKAAGIASIDPGGYRGNELYSEDLY